MATKTPQLTGMAGKTQKRIAGRPKQVKEAVDKATNAAVSKKKVVTRTTIDTTKPTAKNPPNLRKTKAQGDASLAKLRAKQKVRGQTLAATKPKSKQTS